MVFPQNLSIKHCRSNQIMILTTDILVYNTEVMGSQINRENFTKIFWYILTETTITRINLIFWLRKKVSRAIGFLKYAKNILRSPTTVIAVKYGAAVAQLPLISSKNFKTDLQ